MSTIVELGTVATVVSAGAASAGKLLELNPAGLVDPSTLTAVTAALAAKADASALAAKADSAALVSGLAVKADASIVATLVASVATLVASVATLTAERDPFLARPSVGTVDDDEFDTDTLLSGAWTLIAEGGSTPFTRDGSLDVTQAVATDHYRSSAIGGTLFVQLCPNQACVMFKDPVFSSNTGQVMWIVGVSLPFECGTANTQNPKFGLGIWRDLAGFPDNSNRGIVRTLSGPDAIQILTITAGATVSTITSGAYQPLATTGFAMRVNYQGGANAFSGGVIGPRGAYAPLAHATLLQMHLTSVKVGFYLQSNVANTITAPASPVFGLDHFRRLDITASPGKWIAQP